MAYLFLSVGVVGGGLLMLLNQDFLRRWFVYTILPVNLLADQFTLFTSDTLFHTGIMRAVYLGTGYLIVLLPMRKDGVWKWIVGFGLYFTVMILLATSGYLRAFEVLFRIALALLAYPLALAVIRDRTACRRLAGSLVVGLALSVLMFVWNQMSGVGEQEYNTGAAAFTGGLGVYPAYIVTYAAFMLPFLIRSSGTGARRMALKVAFVLGVLMMVLLFRRGPIVALVLGSGAVFVFGRPALKLAVAKGVAAMMVLAIATFPIYADTVIDLYQTRIVEGLAHEMDSEGGRFGELNFVIDEYERRGVRHFLLGTDPFNSVTLETKRKSRSMHVDYLILLHGGGVVGLGLFLCLLGSIGLRFYRVQQKLPPTDLASELKVAFWGVYFSGLLLSATNQLWAVTAFSFYFLCLGAVSRLAYVHAVNAGSVRRQAVQPYPPQARRFAGV